METLSRCSAKAKPGADGITPICPTEYNTRDSGWLVFNWNAKYTRDDRDVMEVEFSTIVRFPWSATTKSGRFPPRKYCFTVPLPSAETQPTTALEPTICPVVENPIATKEFVSGADRTKLQTFDKFLTYYTTEEFKHSITIIYSSKYTTKLRNEKNHCTCPYC